MADGSNVLDEVLKDHAEIKELFARVASETGLRKRDAFQDLVKKLVSHETAEQEIVHPLSNGELVHDERLAEEKEAEVALGELVDLGTDDPRFDELLEAMRLDVQAHAEREELEEHPRIRATVEADSLEVLAPAFRAAEATAPTRPHPSSPTSPIGNLAVGPVVAVMDRARDVVRDVTQPDAPERPKRKPAGPRRTTTNGTTGKGTTTKRTTAKRSTTAKRTTAKRTTSAKRSTTAKSTTAKRTTAKRGTTTSKRSATKRSTAKRSATKRTTAKRTGRMRGPVVDVSPDPRGGWRAQARGASRAIARGDSKQDVVRRARETARSKSGRLVIRGQNGRIQEERTYGPDPSRSRG
jgi:uncharacterized protein DUF2188